MEGENKMIHVYFMPGMGAGPAIFDHIKLPVEKFKIHLLSWKMPERNESLSAYAKRMTTDIKHKNPVLIGVSLGGVIVQEMTHYISVARLIIISSVKTKYELPPRMQFAQSTGIYRILPTRLIKHLGKFRKLPIGHFAKKRIQLYERYMDVADKHYFDWAIKNLVTWDRKTPIEGIVHIHGEKDIVFPIKYITDCIVVSKGTHVMILSKYRWFNKHLPELISKEKSYSNQNLN